MTGAFPGTVQNQLTKFFLCDSIFFANKFILDPNLDPQYFQQICRLNIFNSIPPRFNSTKISSMAFIAWLEAPYLRDSWSNLTFQSQHEYPNIPNFSGIVVDLACNSCHQKVFSISASIGNAIDGFLDPGTKWSRGLYVGDLCGNF